MDDYPAKQALQRRYELLQPALDERLRRLWAAAEAVALGTGGVATLAKATGLARSTIRAGIKQLGEPDGEWMRLTTTGRVRKPGAGRKGIAEKQKGIEEDLEGLMESQEEEPSPLVWTCKSLRRLTKELGAVGHSVSYRTVGNLLHRLGYSFGWKGDYKKYSLPDRRQSFCRIAETAAAFLRRGEPILTVRLQESPDAIAVSHLVISGLLGWWRQVGVQQYPRARRILLTTESAAIESAWTTPLEIFGKEVRLEIMVVHFPPGAWRWRSSIRQITCSCSLLEGLKGVAEIEANLDLVLQG